jgi:hypothetical protein
MRHAMSLFYHVRAVASCNIRFASCGTSGKLTLWTCYIYATVLLPVVPYGFETGSVTLWEEHVGEGDGNMLKAGRSWVRVPVR